MVPKLNCKKYVIERVQSKHFCELVAWYLYDTEKRVELIRCRTDVDVIKYAWMKGISFDDVTFIENL